MDTDRLGVPWQRVLIGCASGPGIQAVVPSPLWTHAGRRGKQFVAPGSASPGDAPICWRSDQISEGFAGTGDRSGSRRLL